jgi:hypothetical protein
MAMLCLSQGMQSASEKSRFVDAGRQGGRFRQLKNGVLLHNMPNPRIQNRQGKLQGFVCPFWRCLQALHSCIRGAIVGSLLCVGSNYGGLEALCGEVESRQQHQQFTIRP